VKSVHVVELRRAVNNLRAAADLSNLYSASETDNLNVLTGGPITATSINSLISNINAARTSAGLSPWTFGNVPTLGAVLKRADVQDLRDALQ
jgi:hypothetical protein